jgi:hypothetical protein
MRRFYEDILDANLEFYHMEDAEMVAERAIRQKRRMENIESLAAQNDLNPAVQKKNLEVLGKYWSGLLAAIKKVQVHHA